MLHIQLSDEPSENSTSISPHNHSGSSEQVEMQTEAMASNSSSKELSKLSKWWKSRKSRKSPGPQGSDPAHPKTEDRSPQASSADLPQVNTIARPEHTLPTSTAPLALQVATVAFPARNAESSTPELSHLKTNIVTNEIQAVEAKKTNEHASCAPVAATTPSERAVHAEDIWDRAYDSLREDDAQLVDAYEKILSSRPWATDQALGGSGPQNTIERGPDARRKQMHKLIQEGLRKTEPQSKIMRGVGETARFVLSAKDIVDSAVRAVPQAALAWAGVCFALQILANPMSDTDANRKGIMYVVSRMDWYWKLSSILLGKNTVDAGASADVRAQLEQQVVDLCKALFTYQMKSICSYFRPRFQHFLRSLGQLDDWDGNLQTVRDAENAVQNDADMYNNLQIRSHLEQLVYLEGRGTELLRDFHRTLQEQRLGHLEEKEQQCLQDLRLSDPRKDKERISATKGHLLRDSYRWILDHPDFRQWQSSEQTRLLWIKGGAGKGKTMLLIGIIDELEKSMSRSDSTFLSFFLCQSTNNDLNNATAVLRGLVYMLIVQQSHLISHVKEEYKLAGKRLFEDSNAFYSLSKIFQNMLHDPRLTDAYLIVDALDECDKDLKQLLSLIIKTASSLTQVKWIVSSRERPDIDQQLAVDRAGISLSLEVNAELVSQAIRRYIDYKVSEFPLLAHNDEVQVQVRQRLYDEADGTFLWVALVFEELQDTLAAEDVMPLLDSVGHGLDPLYERMIDQIQKRRQYSKSCCQVLAVTTLTRRPLHLLELRALADLGTRTVKEMSDLVHLCGSFLTVLEEHVYLIHQSAKEYLTTNATATGKIYPPAGTGSINFDIFTRSLAALSGTLRRDIYELGRPGILVSEIPPRSPDPLTAVRYPCVYWVDHLCDCHSANYGTLDPLVDGGAVDEFLRTYYLYWLEALSLLKSTSQGVLSIAKLEGLLQERAEASRLMDLVRDASRFIRYHKWAIENSPLQVYASALIFSPARSIIRNQFNKEEPKWIIGAPTMADNWSPCVSTLEGHSRSVWSVAWSANATRLASASDDRTVRIWDPAIGTCVSILEGHSDRVMSVAWSADTTRLASASSDHTVRIWDPATGTYVLTLEGHSDSVNLVAWSADATRLASASSDKTVRIWDPAIGTCVLTLKGHSDSVNSVAWLADATRLASASADGTVRIWDPVTGTCVLTLEGYSDWNHWIMSVAWSADATRLASASSDQTVRIWDPATGTCVLTLEGHSDWVMSVAWSADATRLASASMDQTVRIWDPATGTCVSILEGHSSRVISVAWSADATRLASASDDKTVRIWDPATGTYVSTLEGHSSRVISVAWSADATRLASASYDKTVRIWDPATGTYVSILEGHSGWVISIAWSADATRLASASDDKTVRIWDPATGTCVSILEGHSGRVISVAWSVDTTRLASASTDKTVRIWDPATGTCVSTLEGHSGSVMSVAWSADATRLASASSDKTVRIWDPAIGTCVLTLKGHSDSVNSVAWLADATRLASASADGTVRIWDPTTGTCVLTLEGHSDWVMSVAWSADATRLASASSDKTVRIWDPATGTCVSTLEGYSNAIQFHESNSDVLRTNFGTFDLRNYSTSLPSYPTSPGSSSSLFAVGYGLDANRIWITYRGQNLIWLPPEYRPSCSAISETIISIGCSSGRVLIFAFSDDNPIL